MNNHAPNDPVLEKMQAALAALKAAKPEERSGRARAYAVAITEMEKTIAYYVVYISQAPRPDDDSQRPDG